MSYFPDTMPRPTPVMYEAEFWNSCATQNLRFQACSDCGQLRHPPTPICPQCHSTNVSWIDAPKEAEIFSFTVVHHASHPAVEEKLPYVVGILTFEGLDGVRLVSNVTDIPTDQVHIGMKVKLWWDDIGEGVYVPRFYAVNEEEA